MKKATRFFALVLTLVLAISLLSTVASAASTRYFQGDGYFVVETTSPPWYRFWQSPSITVKNEGSDTASIYIYNSKGQIYQSRATLKKGKKCTFKLKKGQTYTVSYSRHPCSGGYPRISVSSNSLVKRLG